MLISKRPRELPGTPPLRDGQRRRRDFRPSQTDCPRLLREARIQGYVLPAHELTQTPPPCPAGATHSRTAFLASGAALNRVEAELGTQAPTGVFPFHS